MSLRSPVAKSGEPMVRSAVIYVFGGSRPKSPASQPFIFSSRSGSQSTHVRTRGPIPPGGNALVIGFPQVGHSIDLRSWAISSGNHGEMPESRRVL
jgi:hypothetical protein